MMRVSTRGVQGTRSGFSSRNSQLDAASMSFASKLSTTQEAMARDALKTLYLEIESLSGSLSLGSPLTEWERYRQMVVRYLDEIKKHCFSLRRNRFWDNIGNQRSLLLIEKIDEELLALNEIFLTQEGGNLAFLARMERLKGLLFDLRT